MAMIAALSQFPAGVAPSTSRPSVVQAQHLPSEQIFYRRPDSSAPSVNLHHRVWPTGTVFAAFPTARHPAMREELVALQRIRRAQHYVVDGSFEAAAVSETRHKGWSVLCRCDDQTNAHRII